VNRGWRVRRGALLAAALLACLLPAGCGDAPAVAPGVLDMGATFELACELPTVLGPQEPVSVASLLGSRATVFYAYSVTCPCLDTVEPRVRALMRRFPTAQGVQWLALAGEPKDTAEQLREKHLRLGSTYTLLADPTQTLCGHLGLDSACEIAVLDDRKRLVYRGALDADLTEGQCEYLEAALKAVLSGGRVPVRERERTYGCFFDDPASCTQREAPSK
jgi:hypothetical protein